MKLRLSKCKKNIFIFNTKGYNKPLLKINITLVLLIALLSVISDLGLTNIKNVIFKILKKIYNNYLLDLILR